jgi:hypothetical protein
MTNLPPSNEFVISGGGDFGGFRLPALHQNGTVPARKVLPYRKKAGSTKHLEERWGLARACTPKCLPVRKAGVSPADAKSRLAGRRQGT